MKTRRALMTIIAVVGSLTASPQLWGSGWRYIGPDDAARPMRIHSPCADDGSLTCVDMTLRLPKGMDLTLRATLTDLMRKVMGIWSTPFLKMTLRSVVEVEGALDPEVSDDLNDFSISFVAPDADFVNHAEAFRLLEKIDPSSGESLAARVYLSLPLSAVEREHLVAYALGRLLGLGSANEEYSLMTEKWSVPVMDSLSALDALWLSSLYASDPTKGRLRGVVVDGDSGLPLRGVTVMALRSEKVEAFVAGQERNLIDRLTYTGPDGSFVLPEMSEGSYYVLVESRANHPLAMGRFDAWLRDEKDNKFFEMEFYDGASRESNEELTYSFSPEAIGFAALLPVTAGADISGIRLITNLVKPKDKMTVADAATQEKLAPSFPQEKNLEAKQFATLPKSSGSGCILLGDGSQTAPWGAMILLVVLACLMRSRGRRLDRIKDN